MYMYVRVAHIYVYTYEANTLGELCYTNTPIYIFHTSIYTIMCCTHKYIQVYTQHYAYTSICKYVHHIIYKYIQVYVQHITYKYISYTSIYTYIYNITYIQVYTTIYTTHYTHYYLRFTNTPAYIYSRARARVLCVWCG